MTVSIAPMLAEVIKRVHFEESISSIFNEIKAAALLRNQSPGANATRD